MELKNAKVQYERLMKLWKELDGRNDSESIDKKRKLNVAITNMAKTIEILEK